MPHLHNVTQLKNMAYNLVLYYLQENPYTSPLNHQQQRKFVQRPYFRLTSYLPLESNLHSLHTDQSLQNLFLSLGYPILYIHKTLGQLLLELTE